MPTRKGPDFVFAAKYRTQCPVCKEFVYEGDKVLFPTKEDKFVIHELCYGKLPFQGNTYRQNTETPPKATSVVEEGPKPVSGGILTPLQPAAAPPVQIEQPADSFRQDPSMAARTFVMLSCWVPHDKAKIVLDAFLEARK